MKTTGEYLTKYHEKYGEFRVQYWYNIPTKWINYDSPEYHELKDTYMGNTANQREVMHDEVIIDIDTDKELTLKQARVEARKLIPYIIKRLNNLNQYEIWFTGSRGFHIHIFFPELDAYKDYELKTMKKFIIEVICKGYMEHESSFKAHVCNAHKHCILCEHGLHWKTGEQKTLIKVKETKFEIKGTKKSYHVPPNYIPKEVVPKFIQWLKEEKKYHELGKNSSLNTINDKGEMVKPRCIKYLFSNEYHELNEGKKRALFILIGFYINYMERTNKKVTCNMIFNYIKQWNDKNKTQLPYKTIKYHVEYQVKESKRKPGCRYIRDFLRDLCKEQLCVKCPIGEIYETKNN